MNNQIIIHDSWIYISSDPIFCFLRSSNICVFEDIAKTIFSYNVPILYLNPILAPLIFGTNNLGITKCAERWVKALETVLDTKTIFIPDLLKRIELIQKATLDPNECLDVFKKMYGV